MSPEADSQADQQQATGNDSPEAEAATSNSAKSETGKSVGSGGPPAERPYKPGSGKRKWAIRFMILLAFGFAVLLLAVQHILLPFILAVVIAYIFSPIVDRISNLQIYGRTIPRWISVILIYLVVGTSIYIFSLVVMPRFAGEFAKLAEDAPDFFRKASQVYIPQFNTKLQNIVKDFTEPMAESEKALSVGMKPVVEGPEDNEFQIDFIPVGPETEINLDTVVETGDTGEDFKNEAPAKELLRELEGYHIEVDASGEKSYRLHLIPIDEDGIKQRNGGFNLDTALKNYLEKLLSSGQKLISDTVNLGKSIVAAVVGSLMTLVLTLMLSAFILIDTPRILAFFRSMCPPRYREEYDDIMTGIDRGLGGVIRGQLLICMVNGTLTGIGLLILGVKYSITLAMIATVFSLVPIFGTILSTIPSVGIALTQSFGLGLAVLIWIVIIHLIEANLLNPKIIGTAARIHPVMVVFALVAGEYAYGLFGALLAVATYSIFQTLFLYFHSKAYPEQEG